MLQKRIDFGSMPFGLAKAGEDIVKGSAVCIVADATYVNGIKVMYPTSQAEADAIKGFATFRIEDEAGSDKSHDVIKAGTWCVVYTLSKGNTWGTTQFVGTPAVGTELVVGYTVSDKGKLRAKTAGTIPATKTTVIGTEAITDAFVQGLGDLSQAGKAIVFTVNGEDVTVDANYTGTGTATDFLAEINGQLTDYVAKLQETTNHLVIEAKVAGAGVATLAGATVVLFGNTPALINGIDAVAGGEVGRATQFKVFATQTAGYGYTDAMIDAEVVKE